MSRWLGKGSGFERGKASPVFHLSSLLQLMVEMLALNNLLQLPRLLLDAMMDHKNSKLFPLEVALVMVFYYINRQENNGPLYSSTLAYLFVLSGVFS